MKSSFTRLIIGILMLSVGGYLFLSSVTVVAGLYSFRFGGRNMGGGLVVVPFIVGVIWLFTNFKSVGAKILIGVGLAVILASLIAGTHFIFHSTSLYSYLILIILIFGGATLILQYLFQKSAKKKS